MKNNTLMKVMMAERRKWSPTRRDVTSFCRSHSQTGVTRALRGRHEKLPLLLAASNCTAKCEEIWINVGKLQRSKSCRTTNSRLLNPTFTHWTYKVIEISSITSIQIFEEAPKWSIRFKKKPTENTQLSLTLCQI